MSSAISLPEILTANVTAATTALNERFARTNARLDRAKAHCRSLSRRKKNACRRRVRKGRRMLAFQKHLLARMQSCTNEADVDKRGACSASVVQRALKERPRRCRRSRNCTLKRLAIRRYRLFVDQMQGVAGNLTTVDPLLASFNTTSTTASEKLSKCKTITRTLKRRGCIRRTRRWQRRIARAMRVLAELKACANDNADTQNQCTAAILARLRAKAPRGCSRRKVSDNGHPRQILARLRKRLRACTDDACRNHVNSLIQVQLKAIADRRARRLARRIRELQLRQALYAQIAACPDRACRINVRRRLSELYARRERRRRRRAEHLTHLKELRARLRLCNRDSTGVSCRRAVYEDFRAAIAQLANALDTEVAREARITFRTEFRLCASNSDPVSCRAQASQGFQDRLMALSSEASSRKLAQAIRWCALTTDVNACVTAARTARDQDLQIAKDDAAGLAKQMGDKLLMGN